MNKLMPAMVKKIFFTMLSDDQKTLCQHIISFLTPELDNFFQQLSEGKTHINIKKIIIHPNYGMRSLHDSDIAVLKLQVEAPLSKTVGLACLPSRDFVTQSFERAQFLVSGWGDIKVNGTMSNILKAAFVFGFSNKECKLQYNEVSFFNAIKFLSIEDSV
jgi:hypothetical protein